MFVYGSDFKRQKISPLNNFNPLQWMINDLTYVFWITATVLLYFLRRVMKLRRRGFMEAFFDISITFIGGGNVRIDHKLEKWLFGIVFLGAFFLSTVWQETSIFPSFLLPNQNIDTFDKLAKVGPTFYAATPFQASSHLIEEMLK